MRVAKPISLQGREVYSSARKLYVSATKHLYDFAQNFALFGARFTTLLHKFALSTGKAKYAAGGPVKG